MSIVLYGIERSPPCQAALLVAKAVGIDVQLKVINLVETKDHKTESFLKMNPNHSVPTLDDNGFYVWDSHAIMGYLVEQYAKDDHLYPKDPKRRAIVNQILHFDNGSLFNSFVISYVPVLYKNEPMNAESEAIMNERIGILDTILSRSAYAAGDRLTIADIALIATLSLPEAFDYNFDSYKNIVQWKAKVKSEIPHYYDVGSKCSSDLREMVQKMKTPSN